MREPCAIIDIKEIYKRLVFLSSLSQIKWRGLVVKIIQARGPSTATKLSMRLSDLRTLMVSAFERKLPDDFSEKMSIAVKVQLVK